MAEDFNDFGAGLAVFRVEYSLFRASLVILILVVVVGRHTEIAV